MNSFKIEYDTNIVQSNCSESNGMILSFEEVQKMPTIKFNKDPNKLYTIIMVDPDAPSRKNPIYKYWLHWLIINNHDIIAPYHPPAPPAGSGRHRYYFYLFEQKSVSNKDKLNNLYEERNNFNLENFIVKYNLNQINCVYFETERE
jgi:phosphatidylethanolamine-binding protein